MTALNWAQDRARVLGERATRQNEREEDDLRLSIARGEWRHNIETGRTPLKVKMTKYDERVLARSNGPVKSSIPKSDENYNKIMKALRKVLPTLSANQHLSIAKLCNSTYQERNDKKK